MAGCHAIHQVLTGVWPSLWWGTPVICKPPMRDARGPRGEEGPPRMTHSYADREQRIITFSVANDWFNTLRRCSLVIWLHLRSRLRNYLRKTFYNPRSLQSLVWQIVCLCWSCVLFNYIMFSSHAGSYAVTECADICMSNLWPKLYSDHTYTCHGGVG